MTDLIDLAGVVDNATAVIIVWMFLHKLPQLEQLESMIIRCIDHSMKGGR